MKTASLPVLFLDSEPSEAPLENAPKARTERLADLTHEMVSCLSVIALSSSMLRETFEDAFGKSDLDVLPELGKIESSTYCLCDQMRDLLDLMSSGEKEEAVKETGPVAASSSRRRRS